MEEDEQLQARRSSSSSKPTKTGRSRTPRRTHSKTPRTKTPRKVKDRDGLVGGANGECVVVLHVQDRDKEKAMHTNSMELSVPEEDSGAVERSPGLGPRRVFPSVTFYHFLSTVSRVL